MKLDSMEALALDELKDIYSAEQQALKGLSKMSEVAQSAELKAAFQQHREESQNQIRRLEQIFEQMGEDPGGKECKAAKGLIEEAQDLIKEGTPGPVLDAGLIGAAQRFEHYEIAAYGTSHTFARLMGQTQAADLLAQTLQEEKQTDQKLTQLAESVINQRAAQQS